MLDYKILIVDDEPRMVDSLKTLLSMEGYSVIGESDPSSAMRRLEESTFDLVITDIKMPGVDGIDILTRAHEKDPYVGVILITGYASLDSAKHAVDKGAFGYLTKPLEMDELKLVVAQSIAKREIELERLRLVSELKVANETLELKLAQINALSSAGNLLAATIDLKEALTSILSLAIDVIGAKIGSVMILDHETEELYIGASCGLDDSVTQSTRMKLGSSISGYVAQAGEPLIVEDIEKDPRFARINLARYESKSLISVPLKYRDEVFGVINLNNKLNGRPFTQEDLNMLASLALPAAVAIDRANLIAEKTQTINELRILHNLAEKVSMLDDPNQIGRATFEGLQRLFDLKFIFWYDYIERGSLLQLEYHFGLPTSSPIPQSIASVKVEEEVISPDGAFNTASIETLLTENTYGLLDGPRDQYCIFSIPIFLKRALAGVAVLGLPPGLEVGPSLREIIVLALSQTVAIYERQRAVLNATQLVTMGRLLADIGHDLKKPLTNLKGSIQVYKDKIDGHRATEFFSDAEKEVSRLSELVKEMVEFANPNKYQTRRIDIKGLVEKSLNLLKTDLENKNIRVKLSIPPGLPYVMVNDREMYQVFINVILNAVDSMEMGGKLGIECGLLAENADLWLRIRIEDSGCGIPEENVHRIFDRYYTTKQTGTGLGLAIVDRIVSVHNGRIDVQSAVGKGTTFTIDLPI
jgi:signal transduction histidine kinase/DNA-binding response OmpR family regulator